MSGPTKIQSTTVQNQSLQSLMSQTTFGTDGDEIRSSYDEPIQTRSKTKMDRMKSSTIPMSEPTGKKKTQCSDSDSISSLSDLEDDITGKLCRPAGERQRQGLQQTQIVSLETIGTKNSIPILSKRQRPTFNHQQSDAPLSPDNDSMDASTQPTATTIKKRKLRYHDISSTIENGNDNDDKKYTNDGKSTSVLLHGSRSEINTTMDGHQRDLFSPVSPVPTSLVNDDAATFTTTAGNRFNKNEKDQESTKVGKQKKDDVRQLSSSPDDKVGNFEFNQSTGGDDENDLGMAVSRKSDSSGGGDGRNNVCKEPLVNLSQNSASSMEWHSDTQDTHMMAAANDDGNELHDTIKSDDTSLNLNTNETSMDEHMQPVGFLKRVASFIFG